MKRFTTTFLKLLFSCFILFGLSKQVDAQVYSSTLPTCTLSADCAAGAVCADGADGNGFRCYDDPASFPNPDGSGDDGPENITQYECNSDADCPIFAPNFSCVTNGASGVDLPAVECRNNGRCGTINQSASEGCEDGNLCVTNENNKCTPTQGGSAFYCEPDANLPSGGPVDCSDDQECTTELCEPATGCQVTNVGDGSMCSDSGVAGCIDGECSNGFCVCVALPVELTDFTAIFENGAFQVSWTTLSEINNAGFEIQLSTDGISFESGGYVDGFGTTETQHDYSFNTQALGLGLHFIRLKQLDYDGMATYSSSLQVTTDVPSGFVLEPAYPNPFNPNSTIRFIAEEEIQVTASLFNDCGQKVKELFEGVVPANEMQSISIDGTSLSSGTYFVRVNAGSKSQMRAITLMK